MPDDDASRSSGAPSRRSRFTRMITALLLLAVLVLVLLNGFFVAAEFAFVRARKAHLEKEAEQGKRGAALAVTIADDLSRYLSACQLGITLTSLGIGFLGEPAIASIFEDLIGTSIPHGWSLAISLALAYLISTSLHITIGEQVPKIYSIQKSERGGALRRAAAGPLHARVPPVHPAAQRRLERDPAADRASARAATSRTARRPRSSRC